MALGADAFDELITSTLQRIDKGKLYDQIMRKHPTLDWLQSKQKAGSGRQIVKNLELAEDSSTQWTDESGTFSTAVSGEILGAAVFDWASPLVSSVRLRYVRLKKNSGKTQVLDLLNAHMRSMEKAHRKELVKALHARADLDAVNGDGTNPVVAGQFLSLDQLCGDATYDADPKGDSSNDNAFKVGGIDAAVQTHWQATRKEIPIDHATITDIRKALRVLDNDLYIANGASHEVNKVICGRSVFEELQDSFYNVAEVRQNPDDSKGQTHFARIFHGSNEYRLDPDSPPRRAYQLDSGKVDVEALQGTFMEKEATQVIPGTLDKVTPVASILATTTSERRALGVLLRPTTAGGDA